MRVLETCELFFDRAEMESLNDPGPAHPDVHFMHLALEVARKAVPLGEVPVGAVVVHNGTAIASAHNRRQLDRDPTAHAELIAMRKAAQVLGDWRLEDCTVYVTLEPCPMCAGAMVLSRVTRCVYGCRDPKGGYLGSLDDLSKVDALNHRFEVVSGVCEEASSALLRDFFRDLRARRKKRTPR